MLPTQFMSSQQQIVYMNQPIYPEQHVSYVQQQYIPQYQMPSYQYQQYQQFTAYPQYPQQVPAAQSMSIPSQTTTSNPQHVPSFDKPPIQRDSIPVSLAPRKSPRDSPRKAEKSDHKVDTKPKKPAKRTTKVSLRRGNFDTDSGEDTDWCDYQ